MNSGIRDFAVSRAIRELQRDNDLLTHGMIAEYINCDRRTVQRSVNFMLDAQIIKRVEGSMKKGYRYEFI